MVATGNLLYDGDLGNMFAAACRLSCVAQASLERLNVQLEIIFVLNLNVDILCRPRACYS